MSHKRYHLYAYTVLRTFIAIAVASAGITGVAGAQQGKGSSARAIPSPVAAAVERSGSVVLDGKLDETAWNAAKPITQFHQSQPVEGTQPAVRTEVRILYDATALYVGARMYDTLGARGIRAPLARRDQLLDSNGNNGSFNSLTSDKLAIVLDPYHNRIDQAWFEVNPAGVRGDQFNGDPSWDPIWEAATHVDSLGWTAEMRIPYSQLRFSRDSVQTWGLQVWRYTDRLNEQDMWSFWRRNEAGGPAYFGQLTDLAIPVQPRALELLPYIVSREQIKYAASVDPFHSTSEMKINAGGDVKYLLTPSLTLDATFNPDFGQVEVDPASLNLSAFETFYDEKRPFFVAGRSAFSFGGMNCMFCSNTSGLSAFYSRRIGRLPQLNGYVNHLAAYDDAPENTTILGAAKVTGRTKSGFTLGVLDAVTNHENARYVLDLAAPERQTEVEPLTNYFVGRVKKDLRNGATTVGGIVTSTARRLDDSLLTGRLRSHAEATGFDFNHTWHQREYRWMGSALVSNAAGSETAIARTERSSAHYFQRPDRRVTGDGLFGARYDTAATSLRGYGFYTRLAKDNGNWVWETAQNWRSPGFEVNDLAYLDRADYKWMNVNVGRQWTTPGRWYRSMSATVGGQQQFNYDGDRTDEQAQIYYGLQLPNYWNVRTFAIHHPTVDDDRLTRGGPVVRRTGYDFGAFEVSTDARQRAVFDLSFETAHGIDARTHSFTFQPGVAFKPAANVFVSLSPSYNADEDAAQYVTTVSDPTATAFYGNRYVFGFIKTKTVSLNTRVNWTFTPNLTLQLFAQPFIASGAYSSFREFAKPRTVKKVVYGEDVGAISYAAKPGGSGTYTVDPDGAGPASSFTFSNPDFTYRSLRGNAVLRWEYRPGSTVFFVWTQERTGSDAVGTFDFNRARTVLFRDRPTNIFQIKVNYWLGR